MEYADLKNRFTYHAPHGEVVKGVYGKIREHALNYAELIDENCPDGREKSLAITKLEEVVMWANAAIARHGLRKLVGEDGEPPF